MLQTQDMWQWLVYMSHLFVLEEKRRKGKGLRKGKGPRVKGYFFFHCFVCNGNLSGKIYCGTHSVEYHHPLLCDQKHIWKRTFAWNVLKKIMLTSITDAFVKKISNIIILSSPKIIIALHIKLYNQFLKNLKCHFIINLSFLLFKKWPRK